MDEETGLPMKQVTYEPNAKVPNCGTVTFKREDHTLGNLLRHQLLTQDKVTKAKQPLRSRRRAYA
jgi:DNA-directed RNA polymerase subunit L